MKKVRLESVNFKPKDELVDYLYNDFNEWIFQELTVYKNLTDRDFNLPELNPEFLEESLFEPLQFFNLLYESYEIVNENKYKPFALKNHFLSLGLSKRKLHYLLVQLTELLAKNHKPCPYFKEDEHFMVSLKQVEGEMQKLNFELYNTPRKNTLFIALSISFDIYIAKNHIETLLSVESKVEYLKTIRTECGKAISSSFFAMTEKNENFFRWCEKEIEKYEDLEKSEGLNSPNRSESLNSTAENVKIIFSPAIIPTLHNILKEFFPEEQQMELQCVLKEGRDSSQPLYFMDHGNRLADAFNRLKEADMIKGCNKKELQSWLCKNFIYKNKEKKQARFTARYAEQVFSDNSRPCKNPLRFEIKGGEILESM